MFQPKFAICNEVFGQNQTVEDWREICEFISGCGYQAIEIAPFTVAADVTEISSSVRRELKAIAEESGLAICGLHWLLVSPAGLHINARDETVRQRTVQYLRELIHFAGDIDAPVMTFGSPAQRRVEDNYEAAWQRTLSSYRAVLPVLEERKVLLCQESLPLPECDFIQTVEEAQRMVEAVSHPNFGLMLDVKSMSAETSSCSDLIRRFGGQIKHFHANDPNKRAPGYGETDFGAIGAALRECDYQGYISLEPFDYWPDPKTMAAESLRYLHKIFENDNGN